MSKGLPVLATEYRDMVKNFVDTAAPGWAGNFLLGLLEACCSFESAESVRACSSLPACLPARKTNAG